jgi:hypothetical protein
LHPNPSTHSFPLSLSPSRCFCTKNVTWDQKLYIILLLLLIESTKFLLHCLPLLSNHWAPNHSPVLKDLASEILQMSSSNASLSPPLSSTSYPKIPTWRVLTQSGHHSSWLLLGVYTYPMYMTLLCCEISFMHQLLHIMCLVWVQTRSSRLTMTVTKTWSTTMPLATVHGKSRLWVVESVLETITCVECQKRLSPLGRG